ncbi:vanadium-dependent haloperoxidase [Methylomonas paludis]|uniref:Vanadium-dependent haloperoxidase n=1 Tax=Methylomonas paludis TaxID=1173101 RepID=A0A975RA35_9GAMM|nr:vanadium-dependent haloperoxidase [Methylomonas paludis]QWF72050.1 vanadium-dependent haloperoxidase [Methylomonas paludis]
MKKLKLQSPSSLTAIAVAVASVLFAGQAAADAVTDWNLNAIKATKGVDPAQGTGGTASIALNSNVATRIEAISSRAVFDAVNAINHFSANTYYYSGSFSSGVSANSASAAAAQAAHDVLLGTLPTTSAWTNTRAWLDSQLSTYLTTLGVSAGDAGISAGQQAAAAALAARGADFSAIRTTYTPSTNLYVNASNALAVNATGNPGVGLWRPSNGGAGVVDPNTGAPSGFDGTGAIVPAAAIDFNWKNVTPFTVSSEEKQELVALVPPSLVIGSTEYTQELAFVQSHGQNFANPGSRTSDQLLQALYYKQDAELTVNELARLGSAARGFTLNQNAKLFAAVDSVIADARIAAFQSKYDLLFWRPVTSLNADSTGAATTYNWKPLGTTPSHPSSTSGHSTTVSSGLEVLRAFFQSDYILPSKAAVTLSTLPWLVGTNNGTGQLAAPISGQDGTSRSVTTLTQAQLENGRSRIYLGVHYGIDDFQGQTLGLSFADHVLSAQADPAIRGTNIYRGNSSVVSIGNLYSTFVTNSAVSGFYGLSGFVR